MRQLSKRQKKAIETWFNRNWKGAGSIYTIEQMEPAQAEFICQMNDHETFWQNADRFISDLALEKVYA